MKAGSVLLCCVLTALLGPAFSLAEDTPGMQEAVRRLDASSALLQPLNANSGPQFPVGDPGAPRGDAPTFFNYDPLRNAPLISPPPPEVLAPPSPKANKRVNHRSFDREKKEAEADNADWLLKGVEAQTKMIEEQRKAGELEEKQKAATSGQSGRTNSNSLPFSNGGLYSRYTVGGLDALKTSFNDPIKVDSFAEKKKSDPFAPQVDAVNAPFAATRAPIIDPLAITKTETATASQAILPNSRLTINGWLNSVKERERLALQPQQAPTVADLYSQNQIQLKAPDPKLPPPPQPSAIRPNAKSMKTSLPPSKTIKDPNDW